MQKHTASLDFTGLPQTVLKTDIVFQYLLILILQLILFFMSKHSDLIKRTVRFIFSWNAWKNILLNSSLLKLFLAHMRLSFLTFWVFCILEREHLHYIAFVSSSYVYYHFSCSSYWKLTVGKAVLLFCSARCDDDLFSLRHTGFICLKLFLNY